jgi:hypothetical protein
MTCKIHQAFESGDREAFNQTVAQAAAEDLEGIVVHEAGDPCTFCDTVRDEQQRRWQP